MASQKVDGLRLLDAAPYCPAHLIRQRVRALRIETNATRERMRFVTKTRLALVGNGMTNHLVR